MTAIEVIRENSIPEPNSGCWLWLKSLRMDGYGNVFFGGRILIAHRLSYQAHRGDIGDKFVCHKCDTRPCVNPDHLFLGTHTDNMQDANRKGRLGKIHPSLVPAMRQMRKEGLTLARIAEAYGVSDSTIQRRLAAPTPPLAPAGEKP